MQIDTSQWTRLGETTCSEYFEIESGVLAAVAREGSKDDLSTAQENVAFQHQHWRTKGRSGVVVFFIDNLVSLDRDARRLYQVELDPALLRGTALVGSTLLSRAIGSFFLGLARPRIPFRMFADLESALAWAHELNKEGTAR